MKTNIATLLTTVTDSIASLTQDRKDAGTQLADALKAKAEDKDIEPLHQRAALLGHTISGLTGIEANLKGLLGQPAAPVARKTKTEVAVPPAAPEKV